jgi:hypothetical protein
LDINEEEAILLEHELEELMTEKSITNTTTCSSTTVDTHTSSKNMIVYDVVVPHSSIPIKAIDSNKLMLA